MKDANNSFNDIANGNAKLPDHIDKDLYNEVSLLFLEANANASIRHFEGCVFGCLKLIDLEKKHSVNNLLTKLITECEGMKGLSNNPDFFLEMQSILKYNAFAKDVNKDALTQILWETKDKLLEDFITLLKNKRDE